MKRGIKVTDKRNKLELKKLCGESEEVKDLQAKIKAAYLNKEKDDKVTKKKQSVHNHEMLPSYRE